MGPPLSYSTPLSHTGRNRADAEIDAFFALFACGAYFAAEHPSRLDPLNRPVPVCIRLLDGDGLPSSTRRRVVHRGAFHASGHSP